MMRESKLVVLPPWQGYGIGPTVSEAVGKHICTYGTAVNPGAGRCYYLSKTSHPMLGKSRDNSPCWEATTSNHTSKKMSDASKRYF